VHLPTAVHAATDPLLPYLPLFQGDPQYRFDVLEMRHALEGMAAWHAAQRATDEDRQRIRAAFQTMLDAHGKDDPAGEAAPMPASTCPSPRPRTTWCCCR
jgi:GntR family L-lactate dehydrogenase operon transcriptional regulator